MGRSSFKSFQEKEEICKALFIGLLYNKLLNDFKLTVDFIGKHVVLRCYNSSVADIFGTEETYDSSNSIVKYIVQNT